MSNVAMSNYVNLLYTWSIMIESLYNKVNIYFYVHSIIMKIKVESHKITIFKVSRLIQSLTYIRFQININKNKLYFKCDTQKIKNWVK